MLDYFKSKIKYKHFRMKIVNDLNKNTKNKKLKEMEYIEQVYPALMINSILGTYIMLKNQPKFIKFFGCLGKFVKKGLSMYSYLCIAFYGEEKIFRQAAIKDTQTGYHLRQSFIKEFQDHPDTKLFKHYDEIYGYLQFNEENQKMIEMKLI